MNEYFKSGFEKIARAGRALLLGAASGSIGYGINKSLKERRREKRVQEPVRAAAEWAKRNGFKSDEFYRKTKHMGPDEFKSFVKGLDKTAGGESRLYHAAELAGLGTLAYPSVKKLMTGKDMKEKNYHKTEAVGLGILAAPSVISLAKRVVGKK